MTALLLLRQGVKDFRESMRRDTFLKKGPPCVLSMTKISRSYPEMTMKRRHRSSSNSRAILPGPPEGQVNEPHPFPPLLFPEKGLKEREISPTPFSPGEVKQVINNHRPQGRAFGTSDFTLQQYYRPQGHRIWPHLFICSGATKSNGLLASLVYWVR